MIKFKLKVFSVVDPKCAVKPETAVVRKILDYWGYDHYQKVDHLWYGWPSKLLGFIEQILGLDSSYTHVMFLDGRDVVLLAPPEAIMERWLKFCHGWVFGAEPHIWSPKSFTPEQYPTPTCAIYRYLNSGTSLGERQHILDWFGVWTNGFTEDPRCKRGDQDWYAERFIRWYPDAIKLDCNCTLFQNMCGSLFEDNPKCIVTPGKVYNTITGTYPLVIHYNGGDDITSEKRRELWNHWPIT